jgi:tight adherence protein B
LLNLIAVFIFLGVCFGLLAWAERSRRTRWFDVIKGESGERQAATEVQRPGILDHWEKEALRAGLAWTRYHLAGFAAIGSACATLLAVTGHGQMALIALAAGLLGPLLWVRRLSLMRSARFAEQLPQALFLAASVLRAGSTLLQAVDAIAGEMPAPMGEEFTRIQQQMRLHIPAHEAMQETMDRLAVPEFAAVVVATRIASEVGGNLAHIFDQIARSVIEQQNARRMLHAFTTEGRMSANLIAALPVLVLGLLHLLSPGYLEPLFGTWTGRTLLLLCSAMILSGWLTIRRMTEFELF